MTFNNLIAQKPDSNNIFIGSEMDIDGHISSFLKSTHNEKVDSKAEQKRKDTGRKKLKGNDWEEIARKSGKTTIISLLYRKRMKSNYWEIDTYLHPALDAVLLFQCVLTIVNGLNSLLKVIKR
ncbi:hypothetical protein MASR2M39_04050 [Ignavibacteriales bacterium]